MQHYLRSLRRVRQRSLNECTLDAMEMFGRLAKINSDIFRWKKPGKSKRAGLANPFIDFSSYDETVRLLSDGVNRRDVGNGVIVELGYSISLWNGAEKEKEAADISYSNGVFTPYVSNVFLLKFPSFPGFEENNHIFLDMIKISVDAIDADWASLFSIESKQYSDMTMPILDKAIYLSNTYEIDFDVNEATQCLPYANGKIYLK